MANITRNFIAGKMNKSLDERIVPNGEYIDALNVRMGSTEESEVGVIENAKGNIGLTELSYNGAVLSLEAKCIGAFEDGANETIYWFVHDSAFTSSPTGKLDLIVSYDVKTENTTYHVISINDGSDINTTLNFSKTYLITGVNMIEDLLFFTDNLNPPRKINVKNNYANPSLGFDGFTQEEILVIKKPPINSPSIVPLTTTSQENFLEDRFVCFAYRYRYADGEYSATSQFSAPAFIPKTYRYDFNTALNGGMLNAANVCEVTYNSGGPLVKSIDLLFKDMNTSVIKVIEKLDKEDLGLASNTEYTYTFDNSKIFTILPDSEILRLFDNVPRFAQAQTMMGNRIIYGNYVEGYNLIDLNGFKTKIEYTTDLVSNDIGFSQVEDTYQDYTYTLDGSEQITDAHLDIDLTDKDLIVGASLNILFRLSHAQFSGDTPFPNNESNDVDIDFTYILPQSFNSVYELATSIDFLEKVGLSTNIQTVADSCNGSTLTDTFNCSIPLQLDSLYKYDSGVDGLNEPIKVIASPASQKIGFVLPVMRFVDDPTGAAITQSVYEYYRVESADVAFQNISNPTSLHSNRGYEVAIIYMDEYNRSTNALVSPTNTVHVPCSDSSTQNIIDVTIPTTQVAPSWAKRYKFAIKPDKKDYNVIYTNFFFKDPSSGFDYFLLDGQNSTKIEEGDELIVKSDASGPRQNCTWTTVLEKKAQESDFLTPPPVDASGAEIPIPSGTYMKLKANNFSTDTGDLPVVAYGEYKSSGSGCRGIAYPVDTPDLDNPGTYIDYTIPEGSKINIDINCYRTGIRNVGARKWKVDAFFTASKTYDNFKEWFEGDNIAGALEAQATTIDTEGPNYSSVINVPTPCDTGNIYVNFVENSGRKFFSVKGVKGYSGNKAKASNVEVTIEVIRSANTVVFESDPQDAEPDLWYESSVSYGITDNGEHEGNIQNQDFFISQSAIIRTDFFNCYSFGNGVESYKIRDSLVGKELVLGNRATTTDAEEYSEERRASDLTYSGVYNIESNINKLNEFNGGLLNFKSLEQSFGPVMKLFGRSTDVLTLQEDKISYVLAGKNLLSDASGGSALTSVPEVLGTQIARTEDYGISRNPESFASWGANKYFTDAKRGSVIQLKGSSAQSDQLTVISEQGMRSWFRNLFTESFTTQKLGGYDPYMNEYVLSSNDDDLPAEIICKECGITETITISLNNPYSFCYNLGVLVGEVNIDYEIIGQAEGFTVEAEYNGVFKDTGAVSTSGVLTIDKNKVDVGEINVIVTTISPITLKLTVNCPQADEITIVLVHLNTNIDADDTIHDEYRWSNGAFSSPLHSERVTFLSGLNPVVSMYKTISGPQGGGVIPANGAIVTMFSNKQANDTFNFDPTFNDFKYLRTDTLYENNATDINALVAASFNEISSIIGTEGDPVFKSNFVMPSTGDYLYLIWDYRKSTSVELCLGDTIESACCDCIE